MSDSVVPRYVFIRPGALGDALLAFPTLGLLRRLYPAAHSTLVARPDVLHLARSSALADAAYAYDDPAWSVLFAEEPSRSGTAFEVVNGNTIVAWLSDANGAVLRNLAHLGARQVVVAPSRPADGSGVHAALHLARTLQPLGLVAPATTDELAVALPPLIPSPDDERAATPVWSALGFASDATVVALHAGSGGAAKRWSPASFGALAIELRGTSLRPLLIEGPHDADVTHEVRSWAGEAPLPTVEALPLGALVAVLRRCAACVGNDSGVTHLAALAGTPTLALFGPSDPALWAPLGRRTAVLRSPAGALDGLGVAEVLGALSALLSQR
jgi:heptosyltransferase-2